MPWAGLKGRTLCDLPLPPSSSLPGIPGFRPLCMGKQPTEKRSLPRRAARWTPSGARFLRDIRPGRIVTVGYDGVKSDTRRCGTVNKHLCVFEFFYFARPDSVIDGTAVSSRGSRAGAFLAAEHPVEADGHRRPDSV